MTAATTDPRSPRTIEEQREYERNAVAEHYEHDPEIFGLVLDGRLGYATGIFQDPAEDLETAQVRKYRWIADRLDIQPGDDVLDVGCGWGSNLLHLAEVTQGTFHGVTLSPKQQAYTLDRARERGIADRVRVDEMHIEDLELAADSVAAVIFVGSVVHMHNREEIYGRVARALRPGGRLLISDCFFPAQVRGDRQSTATHYIFFEALGYCRLLRARARRAQAQRHGRRSRSPRRRRRRTEDDERQGSAPRDRTRRGRSEHRLSACAARAT
jgi:cyclopropane-fatty-acyl-phospholipid synthase